MSSIKPDKVEQSVKIAERINDLNVVCLGDVNYKVGYGVMVRLPETVYNDVFCYITALFGLTF